MAPEDAVQKLVFVFVDLLDSDRAISGFLTLVPAGIARGDSAVPFADPQLLDPPGLVRLVWLVLLHDISGSALSPSEVMHFSCRLFLFFYFWLGVVP